jgi:carbamoyltransferase
LCHIASCLFLSGFNQAAFISLDGLGDFSTAMWGRGDGTRFYVMDRVFFPHSAGFFYTAGTQFLGFLSFGDEYKVMGLAAYGKPVYLDEFRKMIKLKPKGKFELQLDYFTQHRGQSKVRWEGGKPEQDILFSPRWTEIFGNPREAHEAVKDREKNMAASMQAVLEEIYFHVLNYLYQETKADNLCVAGGVAFNSVANGKITKNTPFKNIYIQPAAGDSGTSIGAAAYVYHAVLRRPRRFVMNQALYGSEFTDTDVEKMLKDKKLSYDKLDEEELIRRTVKALTEEKIVGWFQGKMEFGPRALGNRSILADPRCARMKDILNERIKRRESFRPFAPAVPEEYAGEYFEMDCPVSPFMLKVFPVRPEKKTVIPAITHVDGTARVQTVSKSEHPIFWKLLTAFGKETGVYVLLNTSFNENEPIVCTPQEAVECFIKTKMDVLVLGNYFAVKEE